MLKVHYVQLINTHIDFPVHQVPPTRLSATKNANMATEKWHEIYDRQVACECFCDCANTCITVRPLHSFEFLEQHYNSSYHIMICLLQSSPGAVKSRTRCKTNQSLQITQKNLSNAHNRRSWRLCLLCYTRRQSSRLRTTCDFPDTAYNIGSIKFRRPVSFSLRLAQCIAVGRCWTT